MSTESKDYPINHDWEHFYVLLEGIRRSGICNMFGATPYLASLAQISEKEASEILVNWIHNYDELKKLYWPEEM
jgi:hypothetical protein